MPLLGPANLFLVVWLTINALQLFDEVYLTTRGGPLHATTVIVYYLWDQAFVQFNAGYAAAMAYALFVVIVVFTGAPVPARPEVRALLMTTTRVRPERHRLRDSESTTRAPCACPSARGTSCSSRSPSC